MEYKIDKKYETLQYRPWQPNRPTSKGSTAYHDAVVNADYYMKNVDELADIMAPKIKEDEVVVDFGAGTGVSALRLLKKVKLSFKLYLVDNSAAWLGKAYEILSSNQNVKCFLLEKLKFRYTTLAEAIGEEAADHVISANTVHLIPNLEETFKGINESLKPAGSFTFQSGNITRPNREKGILMVDDTINRVHDLALDIVRTNNKFAGYREDLDKNIESEGTQRKFVFPEPRPEEFYINVLESCGFDCKQPHHKIIKIKYKDWLDFLRVKRLQAGILPEVGGKEPSSQEENDRDDIITMASKQLFKELQNENPFADDKCFTAEWVYFTAAKKE